MKYYLCTICRLKNLDPFVLPVTICAGPFKVDHNTSLNRDFHISAGLEELLYKNQKKPLTEVHGRVQLQLRCMKLNSSSEIQKDFENSFPNFCHFNFNGSINKKYEMERQPILQKKRKDEVVNLTGFVRKNKNHIDLVQQPGSVEDTSYICGLFVVKHFAGDDILSYIKNSNSDTFKSSFEFIQQKLVTTPEDDEQNDEDDLIFEKKVNFTMN